MLEEIQFDPPFTEEEEERELIDGVEERRGCFDSRVSLDSAQVECFGFGHRIVDALVKRATQESVEGAAAVRMIANRALAMEEARGGWQFNWLLRVGAVRLREELIADRCGGSDRRRRRGADGGGDAVVCGWNCWQHNPWTASCGRRAGRTRFWSVRLWRN